MVFLVGGVGTGGACGRGVGGVCGACGGAVGGVCGACGGAVGGGCGWDDGGGVGASFAFGGSAGPLL